MEARAVGLDGCPWRVGDAREPTSRWRSLRSIMN